MIGSSHLGLGCTGGGISNDVLQNVVHKRIVPALVQVDRVRAEERRRVPRAVHPRGVGTKYAHRVIELPASRDEGPDVHRVRAVGCVRSAHRVLVAGCRTPDDACAMLSLQSGSRLRNGSPFGRCHGRSIPVASVEDDMGRSHGCKAVQQVRDAQTPLPATLRAKARSARQVGAFCAAVGAERLLDIQIAARRVPLSKPLEVGELERLAGAQLTIIDAIVHRLVAAVALPGRFQAKAIAQHAPTEVEPVVGADSVVLEICLGLRGCTSGLVEDGPSQSVCETICIAFGSPPSLRHRFVLLQHMNMRV